MATFSPSPAPRRSSRLRPQRGHSPPRRTRVVPGSEATSLAATPNQATQSLQFINDNGSIDIDETGSSFGGNPRFGGDIVFARSNEMLVTFYANLPVEVKQVLKNTDFYKIPHVGAIDTLTGFAVVASAQTCFVWQHAQAIKGTPTCYIFSCPRDINQMEPPFHALVPHGPSREPGLILVSPSGEVRFWDSIGIGLAGGENYLTTHLVLKEEAGEQVNNLARSDAQTFVASTTTGSLFRLTLTSSGGKYHLASRSFSRPIPTGSFSRLFPSIFSSSSSHQEPDAFECIYSVALGEQTEKGDKDVWAIARRQVQKWTLKAEGWEELQFSFDLADILEPAIEKKTHLNHNLDLELLDAAVDGDGKLVVLVSYLPNEPPSMAMDLSNGVRRIYTLAVVSPVNDNFEIEDIKTVPYQSTFVSSINVHARIQLLFNGSMTSIQFGDAVALCSRNSDYQDRLELKSVKDRILGVGVDQADSSLLILTADTMMKTNLDLDKINTFDPSVGRTNLIKSIMTQAILFGSISENPLHFSFPPEVDEDSLMQGAEQLSQAVLRSDPEVVRRNHDLSSQLTGRKERLSWLIQFINDNAVLGKMSQQSRQRLATDAEKLYACQQLWIQYNELLRTNPSHSVLHDSVLAYMNDVGDGQHEDVMRAFFRLHVADIGLLIRKVLELSKVASGESGLNLSHFLPEANGIVVTALRSAFDYRTCNLGVYGIELPMIKPWTSRPAIIDVVLSLFDASTKAVESTATERNSRKQPFNQLPNLASILFECIQERIDWLGSPAAANDPRSAQGLNELVQRFDLLRPEVLETLRRIGHEDAAFALAEKYRDFSSLAALCHRDVIYPPENNPNAARIQSYVDRFKDDFTTELYQWYIQHGELRVIFSQEAQQGVYIDRFFAEQNDDGISWIYDLGQGRYGAVAASMLSEAKKASNLEAKHLMLSIGKLSHLAQLREANAEDDDAAIDAFHDELDFVSVLEALAQEFRSALEGVRGRHSLDSQIDIIIKAKASKILTRKTMSHVFKDILRQLLQGKALSIEDAVDLLTLKDNADTVDDYVSALHLLARVPGKQLPEARKLSAFRTVWRRIYIHDDWEAIQRTANVSDGQVIERYRNTAAYATLCACAEKLPGLEMTPNESLQVPTQNEIDSRWPGMSPDQVEGVLEDYNLECDILGELNLQDVYFRLRNLVEQNAWEGV